MDEPTQPAEPVTSETPPRDERGRFAPADQAAEPAPDEALEFESPKVEAHSRELNDADDRAEAAAKQQAEREEALEKQRAAAEAPATTPQEPGDQAEAHAEALAQTVAANPSRTVYVMGGPLHDSVLELLRVKHGFEVVFDHVRGVHAVTRLADPSGEVPAAPATLPPPVEPSPTPVAELEAEPEV